MKIDLLKFVEKNEELEEEQLEIKIKRELRRLISSIIQGEEYFYTNCEDLYERIGIKYVRLDSFAMFSVSSPDSWGWHGGNYKTKLTKANIRKIQEYINGEE